MNALGDLLGDSPGMRSVRERIARLLARPGEARRLPPILVQGETGTGKGLVARMIHRAGPRPDGPFVDVNCAAIPDTLLEAEMFGYERGAFTDARRSKPGLLQAAHRGTIFLDEVGLLPEALQAKLLKVLEDRMVRRLGATRDEPVDVWIVTATNEDLAVAVQQRRFREDLYHRLAVLTVALPPLRERAGDVMQLAGTSWPPDRDRVRADALDRRLPALVGIGGRATCASCRTCSSARCSCRRRARSPPRDSGSSRRRRRPRPAGRPRGRCRSTTPCASTCWKCSRRRAGTSRAPPRCSGSHATPCALVWRNTACATEPRRRRRRAPGRPPARRRPARRRSPPSPLPPCCHCRLRR